MNYQELKLQAKFERKNPTKGEKILWEYLKNKKTGYKFKRKYWSKGILIDFYCCKKNLGIKTRNFFEKNNLDIVSIISSGGIILNFSDDLIINNTKEVLNIIKSRL